YVQNFYISLPAGFVFEDAFNDSIANATLLPFIEDPSGSGYLVARGTGSIDPPGDDDFWQISAVAGDRISIALDARGAFNAYVELYTRSGSNIANDDNGGP